MKKFWVCQASNANLSKKCDSLDEARESAKVAILNGQRCVTILEAIEVVSVKQETETTKLN